jgi:sodium-dependent dicarboxylate transporter 2/3/5
MLIGGGIAIAQSFTATGLAAAIGVSLEPLSHSLSPFVVLVLLCTLMTFLTEVTSNTAVTALMLPIVASMSSRAGTDPRIWMLGATLSASCAFMLPIGTPPNAIAFGTGLIPMKRMAMAGFWLNLVGVALISLWVWLVAAPVMGVDVNRSPAWMQKASSTAAPPPGK